MSAAPPPAGDGEFLLHDHVRYQQVGDLGGGAHGRVLLAHDNVTSQQVALKFVKRGPDHINKYVLREIVNQLKLRHPHIISLQEVFLTERHLVLVMEYASGGNLFQYVSQRGGLSEQDARWFFQQLIIALAYCHSMGVTNRDIKLENTLLTGGACPTIKLADFGLSKDHDMHSAPTSRVGTPAYLAPEVINNRPGRPYDARKADLWSAAILLYCMVANRYPFRRATDDRLPYAEAMQAQFRRILLAEYDFPPNKPFSDDLKDLIRHMLVVDPQQRFGMQDIFQHPWFCKDLHPDVLAFNDAMVKESLANLPSPEMLEEVRAIVEEAFPSPRSQVEAPLHGRPGNTG
ncbi:Serine/threonine-protein kinase SRK2A [Chlorella vulgaris]